MARALTWYEPELESALRAAGLDDLVDLAADLAEPQLMRLAEPPTPLTQARTRRLYRLAALGAQAAGGARLFVKLQLARGRQLPPRKWPSYAFKPSPLVREARAASALSRLGLRTPELVAAGARGRFPATVRAVLITREVPATTDLEAWLADNPEPAAAAASIAAVEAAVAQVHAAGFALGGARLRDFLVPLSGASGPSDVVIIDAANFGRGPRRRSRDLRQLAQDVASWRQTANEESEPRFPCGARSSTGR